MIPTATPADAALIKAQFAVYKRAGIDPVLWPRNAGSWPGFVFTDEPLKLPAGHFGLGHGSGAHAPDEYYVIESTNPKVQGMDGAVLSFAQYLYELASRRHASERRLSLTAERRSLETALGGLSNAATRNQPRHTRGARHREIAPILFPFADAFDAAQKRTVALPAIDDALREIVLRIFEDHFVARSLDHLERRFRLTRRLGDEQNPAVRSCRIWVNSNSTVFPSATVRLIPSMVPPAGFNQCSVDLPTVSVQNSSEPFSQAEIVLSVRRRSSRGV